MKKGGVVRCLLMALACCLSTGAGEPLVLTQEQARFWQSIDATPLSKVIELLKAMISKAATDQQSESTQFATYKSWCNSTINDKTKAIATAATQQNLIAAQITDITTAMSGLDTGMQASDTSIANLQNTRTKAVSDRANASSVYQASLLSYMRSIQAVNNAASENAKADVATGQASAFFLQLQSAEVPYGAEQKIDAFLATREERSLLQGGTTPVADAFEFQSSGITALLRKLADKFTAEKTNLEQAEAQAVQTNTLLLKSLDDQVKAAQAGKDSMVADKASKVQDLTSKQGSAKALKDQQAADQTYLSGVQSTCNQKAADFTERQRLRSLEVNALNKAVTALNSDTIQVNAKKHLASLMQSQESGSSFSHLRAKSGNIDAQLKLVNFLQMRARELSSNVLAMLVLRVEADPFEKVKKMITDLVTNLQKQQSDESTQDTWCKSNLDTNLQTRTEKSNAMATLRAQLASMQADVNKLKDGSAELAHGVVSLYQVINTSTIQRNTDHNTNAATIQDAKDAQAALTSAMSTLQNFYANTFTTPRPSLLQENSMDLADPPAIFGGNYTGMTGQSDGVIGLLQVVHDDFARVQQTTENAEKAAVDAYTLFQHETNLDIGAKKAEINRNTMLVSTRGDDMTSKQADLAALTTQLAAANATWASIRQTCDVKVQDTKAKRQEEIQSLKDALNLLDTLS